MIKQILEYSLVRLTMIDVYGDNVNLTSVATVSVSSLVERVTVITCDGDGDGVNGKDALLINGMATKILQTYTNRLLHASSGFAYHAPIKIDASNVIMLCRSTFSFKCDLYYTDTKQYQQLLTTD